MSQTFGLKPQPESQEPSHRPGVFYPLQKNLHPASPWQFWVLSLSLSGMVSANPMQVKDLRAP